MNSIFNCVIACFRGEPCLKKFPTREEFIASYFRQRFSLPDSMIYYITKNPSSCKVYQKMIQSCKHFFIKNQILVFCCLQIHDGGWKVCSGGTTCYDEVLTQSINITTENFVGCKIWIQNRIHISSTKSSNIASNFIPKIYQCDADYVYMIGQHLSLEQFLFYSETANSCFLKDTYLYSENDTEIFIEALIASLPNLQNFCYEFLPSSRNVSKDTVAKLLQIPHFKNIIVFHVYNLSEDFDIDTFYDYYKKNKHMDCVIVYNKEMPSLDFTEKLDAIVDEILDDEFFSFSATPFSIEYTGQDNDKRNAMFGMRDS